MLPPTLEKLKGHIAFGSSMRPSIRLSMHPFKIYKDTVLKFHIWIPHQKMIDTYFFESLDYPPGGVMPFLKGHNEIL